MKQQNRHFDGGIVTVNAPGKPTVKSPVKTASPGEPTSTYSLYMTGRIEDALSAETCETSLPTVHEGARFHRQYAGSAGPEYSRPHGMIWRSSHQQSPRTLVKINSPIRIPSSGHLRPDPISQNPQNSPAILPVFRNRLKPNLTQIWVRS